MVRDLTGQKFGRLFVEGRNYPLNGKGKTWWKASCDCGRSTIVDGSNLKFGITRSCGCLARELTSARSLKHGATRVRTPEYVAWLGMIQRCEDRNCKTFARYGERGISICRRWRESFAKFYIDMGDKPSPRHSLGRINNAGNYHPGNCRWELPKQQARNRRSSHFVTAKGFTRTIAEWAEITGINQGTISHRLRRGWSDQSAISQC